MLLGGESHIPDEFLLFSSFPPFPSPSGIERILPHAVHGYNLT